VLPGSYNVSLVVDGTSVSTKPMNVVLDPKFQMSAAARRQYFDLTSELHELQRRGTTAASALNDFNTQMEDLAGKVPDMTNVPDSVKSQFTVINGELETVREKFGVPFPAAGAGGGRGGRGGGRGGGGGGNDANVLGRVASVKNAIMAFYDAPSASLTRQAETARRDLPRAIDEANALFGRATSLSQALAKYNVTLTVPAQVR
jgi:hypothetical protein